MAKRHIKFFRYYKEWIETYKKYQISEITYSKYDLTYRYLKKVHPDLYLDELTRQKVQMIINEYGETHEIETSKDFLHRLQAPLRDAAYEGWVSKDPTYKVVPTSRIPHKVTRAKYLEADEAEKLEKVLSKDHSIASVMCDFDLRTGLRFAEVLGLTPADIDFQKKTIDINKTWDYKKGVDSDFMPTKNKFSNRIITIDDKAMHDLQYMMFGVKQDEPIFVKALTIAAQSKVSDRQPRQKYKKYVAVYNSTINVKLSEWCEKAGVPRISFHGLRHTHASILITNGVSIQSVADRLGHADTTTTQKVYIHLLKKLKAKDDQKILGVMNGLGE